MGSLAAVLSESSYPALGWRDPVLKGIGFGTDVEKDSPGSSFEENEWRGVSTETTYEDTCR
jgi:hypothetical protein